jgi:hypothetical protein
MILSDEWQVISVGTSREDEPVLVSSHFLSIVIEIQERSLANAAIFPTMTSKRFFPAARAGEAARSGHRVTKNQTFGAWFTSL